MKSKIATAVFSKGPTLTQKTLRKYQRFVEFDVYLMSIIIGLLSSSQKRISMNDDVDIIVFTSFFVVA
jgi:hypothetical protein